jgi:hypothetical protein
VSQRTDSSHDVGGPDWAPHDDLPAYALGLLTDDERAEFEQHLSACLACQHELAAHANLREQLARGLPPRMPPEGARERLLARARAMDKPPEESGGSAGGDPPPPSAPRGAVSQVDEPPVPLRRAALDPIPATSVQHQRRPRRIRLASLGWAAALLFVVAAGLSVGAWSATGPHASLTYEIQARLPGGQILPLAGTGVPAAKARLFVIDGGRSAELAIDRLPPLREGRVYQLWFAEPGEPIRTGGAFRVDPRGDAVARVTISAPLERMRAVAVTEEPAPGSSEPTGPHLLDWPPQ